MSSHPVELSNMIVSFVRYNSKKIKENFIRALLIHLFIFIATLSAEQLQSDNKDFSVRFAAGPSDLSDLSEIGQGQFNIYEDCYVFNLDLGYRFAENASDLPLDWYVKGGVSYFNERFQEDFLEATLYVKVIWKIDFWQNRLRLGFGEGLSLAEKIPEVETIDAIQSDGSVEPSHKFLNYLDISMDFDLGRLIGVEYLEDFYIGYTIKHRSGVFGTFYGVHGGSNYSMFTLEKNF